MLTDQNRAQLAAVRAEFGRQVEAIRADATLSRQGKRLAIAREHRDATAAMRQVTESARANAERSRRDLVYKLFGQRSGKPGAETIALRDAMDRARGLDSPGDAARALAEAEAFGDAQMAKVIVAHAWAQMSGPDVGGHWGRVVETYVGAHQELSRDFAALAEIDDAAGDDRGALRDRLHSELAAPEEIQTGSPYAELAEAEAAGANA